jgi:ATP-binding cassette subfamily F protein 3
MILIAAKNLGRQFSDAPILGGIGFEVRAGDRIGLVGPNGVGKTTLLRLLAGLDEPDVGAVEVHPSVRVSLLRQEADLHAGDSVFESARRGLQPLLDLQSELQSVSEGLARAGDAAEGKRLARRYDRLQHELDRLNGYAIDHRVEEVLLGLGFSQAEYAQPACTLSGGQQSRLMLARLLLDAPDVMLLDEPSNHLDLESTTWLEKYLAASKQAMMVVSHDRFFLDKVTTRIFELFDARLEAYVGNFSAYWRQRGERLETQRRTYERQQDYIAEQQAFIRRYQYGQRHQQAHDRERKLERVERVEKPREIAGPSMTFGAVARSGDIVVEARGVTKGFDRPLFEDVDLVVERGWRLGILGPNGSGKTTFLRVLLGELPPDAGSARLGHNVKVGYYDQQLALLPEDSSVIRAAWPSNRPDVTEGTMRNLLAAFGLTGDIVLANVRDLSGGEKSRVALARLVSEGANLLVLDEPTNHLDLWARAALEASLAAFEGTVVFVSHDRYFLNQVADRLLVFGDSEADPLQPRLVEGNYDTYRHLRAASSSGSAVVAETTPSSGRARPDSSDRKTGKKKSAGPGKGARRRFPYRKVADLEADIAEKEAELGRLETALADPKTFRDGNLARQVQGEYDTVRKQIEALYEHWEEAVELN